MVEFLQSDDVRFEVDDGVLIVELGMSRLTQDFLISELAERIEEELPRAETAVLIDCQLLTKHVSSQFLALLVRLKKRLAKTDRSFCVCELRGLVVEAFQVSGLYSFIPLYTSRHEALKALARCRLEQAAQEKARSDGDAATAEMVVLQPQIRMQSFRRRGDGERWSVSSPWLVMALAGTLVALPIAAWLNGLSLVGSPRPARSTVARLKSGGSASSPVGKSLSDRFETRLQGRVQCVVDGKVVADDGAMIIAWSPRGMNKPGESPPKLADVFVSRNASDFIWVATASRDGKYRLTLPTSGRPDERYLLLVSAKASRTEPMPPNDRDALLRDFPDAETFLGQRDYLLTRCPVEPGRPVQFDWKFATPSR